MRKSLVVLLIGCFLYSVSAGFCMGQESTIHKEISEFISTMVKECEVPGAAVGIVKDGNVMFSEGFGLRNVNENLPVTSNTLFVLASVTKAFITMAMGILVDDGLLDWDEPVRTYIPNFILKDEFATARITPRDMITHRSGLPRHDYIWVGSNFTPEQLVESLRYLEPSADLRTRYQYNNLMYISAGYLIGKVAGTGWDEFVKQRIFSPLGMTSSTCSVNELKLTSEFARAYRKQNGTFELVPFPPPEDILRSGPRGSGSINSNINDMTKWLLFHLNKGEVNGKRIISRNNIYQMHSPQIATPPATPERSEVMHQSYGLGWSIDSYKGHYRVHHGGSSMGFTSHITFFPHENFGVVVLSNGSSPLPDIVCNFVSDMLLEKETADWQKRLKEMRERRRSEREKKRITGTKPAHELKDYTGDYKHPAYGLFSVTLKNGKLETIFHHQSSILEHLHYETFTNDERTKITFHTNDNGKVESLTVPLEPAVDDIVFIRSVPEDWNNLEFLKKFMGVYTINGTNIRIFLNDENIFSAIINKKTTFELILDSGTRFNVKSEPGSSIEFVTDDSGKVISAIITQPNGTFTAKKTK